LQINYNMMSTLHIGSALLHVQLLTRTLLLLQFRKFENLGDFLLGSLIKTRGFSGCPRSSVASTEHRYDESFLLQI
jgi:hypothetical protein